MKLSPLSLNGLERPHRITSVGLVVACCTGHGQYIHCDMFFSETSVIWILF